MSVLVKICGVTCVEDARLCHEAGADWIGLVFAPGPRRVSTTTARLIREAVPEATLVGVFVCGSSVAIAATARMVGLDMLQLHRPVDPVLARNLREQTGLPQIQLAEPNPDPRLRPAWWLFDLPKGRRATRAARESLWERAAGAARHQGLPVVLAGRLTADDVAAAVAAVSPAVVDVSSGVERAPGRKSPTLVRRFIEEVRRA